VVVTADAVGVGAPLVEPAVAVATGDGAAKVRETWKANGNGQPPACPEEPAAAPDDPALSVDDARMTALTPEIRCSCTIV
jgi:hypothetical protein